MLSGLSPFQGNNDKETLVNVISAQYKFEEEFSDISETAKTFIDSLLQKSPWYAVTVT